MIDSGLYQLLAADAGVSAICAGRIFSVDIPPDNQQLPALAYSMVGGAATPTFTTSGVFRQRVQLDAFGDSYDDAASLRAAGITAVNGWCAVLSDGTRVLSASLLNPGTDFCGEDRIFRCMCEFYILHTLPS